MKSLNAVVFISFALLSGIAIGLFLPTALSPQSAATVHDHKAHNHGDPVSVAASDTAPTLDFALTKDASAGWNVNIMTTNFRFAPAHASGQNVAGEGHVHLYVNGEKHARVYGPWFHLADLPAGATLTLRLYSNDHSPLAVDGALLSITKTVPTS